MTASPQSSHVKTAATHGSAHSAKQVAKSTELPAPIGQGNPQASGQTRNLTRQHDRDLPCVGSWVADGQYQDTDPALDNVRSNSTDRAVCARHRNMQEACLDSTSNATVIELLRTPNTEDLATKPTDGGGRGSSLPACTCDGIIQVDGK